MLSSKTRTCLFLMMLIYIWFLKIQTTSADIFAERTISGNKYTATTLSFSMKNSFNSLKKQSLFNTSGIIPEGFDVGAIRMVKDGAQNFQYYLKIIPDTNTPLCDALNLEILNKDLTNFYNGPLNNTLVTKTISPSGKENWVMFLELNNNSENLKQLPCNFKIQIRTYRNSPDEPPTGLYAQAEIQNTIYSGNW